MDPQLPSSPEITAGETASKRADASPFRGGWLAAITLVALVLACIVPTLSWLEFTNGSENLNAGTVLEMHRGGSWLVPTLNGQTRLAKPPLTAWTSAALVPGSVFPPLESADATVRDAAYRRLAFHLRWPTLVLACITMLGAYATGRSLFSPRVGWAAAAVCGSTLLFLRFGRAATTDVQLACWVSLANALFASHVFGVARAWKLLLIGVTLGLSMLAKGPVGLAMTVAPWLLFALLDSQTRDRVRANLPRTLTWTLAAALIALALSIPWFAYVLLRNANAMEIWRKEITREGATMLEPDPWWDYVSLIFIVLPWTLFFIAGLGTAFQERAQRTVRLLICLLIVPIVILSFAKDKNDRYLVPLLPAVSIFAALALRPQFLPSAQLNKGDRFLRIGHWITVAVLVLALPALSIANILRGDEENNLFTMPDSTLLLAAGAALLVATIWTSVRLPGAIAPATLLCMLFAAAVAVASYTKNDEGRSELKPITDAVHEIDPNTRYWFYDPPEHTKIVPPDIGIYLNRPVRTARDEPTLMTAAEGDIVFMVQRKGTPEPTVDGWTALTKRGENGRYWWALRRATTSTQPAAATTRP